MTYRPAPISDYRRPYERRPVGRPYSGAQWPVACDPAFPPVGRWRLLWANARYALALISAALA
jgi:hypothetical protein